MVKLLIEKGANVDVSDEVRAHCGIAGAHDPSAAAALLSLRSAHLGPERRRQPGPCRGTPAGPEVTLPVSPLRTWLQKGATPLLLAALEGYLDIVKALLEKGADATPKDTVGGSSFNDIAETHAVLFAGAPLSCHSLPQPLSPMSDLTHPSHSLARPRCTGRLRRDTLRWLRRCWLRARTLCRLIWCVKC